MGAAGDGYAPGYGNSQNLNGGGRNLAHASPATRDLCGGTLTAHFSAGGTYGPTDVSAHLIKRDATPLLALRPGSRAI
jgi:hypothetical protein